MGVPTSEAGYTSATTERETTEVHKGHEMALARPLSKKLIIIIIFNVHYVYKNKQNYTFDCNYVYSFTSHTLY
jgi:hypothetical protein